ncbi:hypothetical protein D3C73_502480 [compost metagenome]
MNVDFNILAEAGNNLITFLLGLSIADDLIALNLKQRRLGDVNIARFDNLPHVAVEEGQQQCSDMGTVDIRIGHDNNLMVTGFGQIKIITDAGSQSGDNRPYFGIGQYTVKPRFFNVQDLPAERQNRLEMTVTALLGRTACRVPFDDVQLADGGILGGAVSQLPRQGAYFKCTFAAGQFTGLAGRFTGTGSLHGFLQHTPGHRRILFQELLQLLSE